MLTILFYLFCAYLMIAFFAMFFIIIINIDSASKDDAVHPAAALLWPYFMYIAYQSKG